MTDAWPYTTPLLLVYEKRYGPAERSTVAGLDEDTLTLPIVLPALKVLSAFWVKAIIFIFLDPLSSSEKEEEIVAVPSDKLTLVQAPDLRTIS